MPRSNSSYSLSLLSLSLPCLCLSLVCQVFPLSSSPLSPHMRSSPLPAARARSGGWLGLRTLYFEEPKHKFPGVYILRLILVPLRRELLNPSSLAWRDSSARFSEAESEVGVDLVILPTRLRKESSPGPIFNRGTIWSRKSIMHLRSFRLLRLVPTRQKIWSAACTAGFAPPPGCPVRGLPFI